jgi:hypothetical protein
VRVIFRLPRFCHHRFPNPLVFVELFNKFSPNISPLHRLAIVDPLISHGQRVYAVVPLSKIQATCQLVVQYSTLNVPYKISSNTDTLSIGHRFYLNRHSSYYFFSVMEHWRRVIAH